MSVDLRALPLDHDSPTFGYSHTVLSLPTDYDAHARLVLKDAYGRPIQGVTAGAIVRAYGRKWTRHPAICYLRALPPDTRVMLDWH